MKDKKKPVKKPKILLILKLFFSMFLT